MSSYLRGSTNYMWSTTSILGQGATATVYQGVNKINGEPVAVKTFNHVSMFRPQEVQFREFEVLRKVKHENIVKLLAIEEEKENRRKVIVMELCTGGSLLNSLDDPENTYGLEESEFLLVLAHIYAGMKHLRDNNLIHRDLKPANIMKFIREDGSTVYKLTDFGAARELQEDQSFQSLYGTEEYLHPDMYERAVLRKPVNKKFGATIDLWSIGVTLYHVATGNLPFRPFGGRRNKEIMHHITTKKESGVISGIQTKENGPIEWKRDLPTNCQLSEGLKKIITPILAGLLEADNGKIWSFERFFKEVDVVLSRKAINIFHVNKARLIKVYILPDETYQHLQSYITEQTEIKDDSQILLYRTSLFTSLIQDHTRSCCYPKTTEEDPLFLFNKENNNIIIVPYQELPKWIDFSTVISVENDAAQAKYACIIGHHCKRQVQKYSLYSKLICDTVENFTTYINAELKQLHQNTQHLLDKALIYKKTAEILQLSQRISNYSLKNDYVENVEKNNKEFVAAAAVGVTNLYMGHCVENTLKLQWDSMSRNLKYPFKTLTPARAKTQVKHLRKSWQHLIRNRATRRLPYNEERFHMLERIKITQTINKIKNLLGKEVFPQYEQLAENFGDWYKMAQNIHLKTDILISDVAKYDCKLKDFEKQVAIDNVDYTEYIQNNFEQANKYTIPKKVRNTQNQIFKKYLEEFDKNSESFKKVLLENAMISNKLSKSTKELENMHICIDEGLK